MSLITITPARPFQHLEVTSGIWFFMNHMRDQLEMAVHDHNYLELAFVIKGQARHLTVMGESFCRPGDVYIIPRGAWHGYEDCEDMEVINCLLSPLMTGKELAWLKEDAVLGSLLGLKSLRAIAEIRKLNLFGPRFCEARDLLERLELAYEGGSGKLQLLGLLLQLLDILRATADSRMAVPQEESIAHPAVCRALDLLHGNLDHDWSLSELAERLGLNPSYLVRLFRVQTSLAPMKYLTKVRAELAANLLLSGQLRIGEVGEKVGWPDPKLFARNFRQYFGMSARDYRRQMLGRFK